MACESFVEHLVGSLYFLQHLNVVGHLAVPAGWGSCLLRLAIFNHDQNEKMIFFFITVRVTIICQICCLANF